MRSYHDFALGVALLLFAAALARTAWIPRPLAFLAALAAVSYLAQGWVVGFEGFSATETFAIVSAFVLDVGWMAWLLVVAWRLPASDAE